MKPLRKNIIVVRVTPEHQGLIVAAASDETPYGKVLAVGSEVTMVQVEEKVLIDWRTAKHINADLFSVDENDIMAVIG